MSAGLLIRAPQYLFGGSLLCTRACGGAARGCLWSERPCSMKPHFLFLCENLFTLFAKAAACWCGAIEARSAEGLHASLQGPFCGVATFRSVGASSVARGCEVAERVARLGSLCIHSTLCRTPLPTTPLLQSERDALITRAPWRGSTRGCWWP